MTYIFPTYFFRLIPQRTRHRASGAHVSGGRQRHGGRHLAAAALHGRERRSEAWAAADDEESERMNNNTNSTTVYFQSIINIHYFHRTPEISMSIPECTEIFFIFCFQGVLSKQYCTQHLSFCAKLSSSCHLVCTYFYAHLVPHRHPLPQFLRRLEAARGGARATGRRRRGRAGTCGGDDSQLTQSENSGNIALVIIPFSKARSIIFLVQYLAILLIGLSVFARQRRCDVIFIVSTAPGLCLCAPP